MPDKKTTSSACDCSRRSFLKGGVLATAVPAAALSTFGVAYHFTGNRPVRVGVVGTGDQGQVLMSNINPDYVQVKSIADIRPYNLHRAFHGDISSPAALKARQGLLSVYGWDSIQQARKHVAVYTDWRELIRNAKADGLEAIIIGLPLHLHAPAAVYAMQQGLHVLTEKLMAHSVAECKEMARAAKQYGKHLATGHQRHYNILYQEAVDQIRRGTLGDIHYIRAQWHRNNAPGGDSWQMPMPRAVKPDDPQAARLQNELTAWTRELNNARGLAIEEWAKKVALKEAQIADYVLKEGGRYMDFDLKSAAEYEYEDTVIRAGSGENERTFDRCAAEELLRWRLWRRTGGGLMVELGSHQLDAATIFMAANRDYYLDRIGSDLPRGEKVYPLKVHVSANRNIFGLDREVSDHVTVLVEFPSPDYDASTEAGRKRKVCMQYSTINGNGFGGYGEIVYGTQGTLVLTSETDSELFRSGGDAASRVAARAAEAAMLDTQSSGPEQTAAGGGGGGEVSRGYNEQLQHWSWCIRNNPNAKDPALQPRCHPKIALADSVISLVTNIAADEGKSITFNEKWFDIDDDATPETEILNDPNGRPSLHKAMYSF